MPITKQWPGGATNATPTSFSLPLNNELNWLQLTSFLQSLADSAQGTTFQKFKVRVVTASPDTISATADCILAVNVAGAVTINLPAGAEKQIFFIVDSSGAAATNNITITPNGSETVRGGASLVLNKNYQGVVLAFTGTDWKAFGPFTTPGSITDADFTGQLSTAKGGTGQNSTATFPTSGTVATVPAAGVVKSSGTALTSSNVNLTSEVTGTLPVANGGTGITSFGTGVATFLGTPSSANLASAVTDETGTGALVFANTPTLVTPILGTPQSATLTNATGLPIDAGTTGTLPASRGGTGVTSLGTGVATALGQNVTGSGSIVLSGSPTFTGTPISPSVQISGTAGAGFVELAEQSSSPGTPASGFARIYPKTDNKLYLKDDAGVETQLGAGGVGEINVVENPSDANNWGTSNATVTTTTTAADLPLGPLVDTAIEIASSTSGGYARYRWTMPVSLRQRKLKVAWQQVAATLTSGDYKVEVYKNSASDYSGSYTEFSLSTDSSGTSSIPNLNGQYQTTFDSDDGIYYELRVVRTAASSATIRLAGVTVGPGIQPQGAVIGEWNTYTPTVTNLGSGSGTALGRYRRVGTNVEIIILFTKDGNAGSGGAGVTFSLPSGLTLNSTIISNNDRWAVGVASSTAYTNAFSTNVSLLSNNVLRLGTPNSDLGGSAFTANSMWSMQALIPIAEWSGSGTVQIAQNDVEYAWNSSTSTSNDTTSFGYGPQGVLIRDFAPSTTSSIDKRVRFQTPRQPGDVLVLETDEGSSGARWVPLVSRLGAFGYDAATPTYAFGTMVNEVSGSATDVDVRFFSKITIQSTNTWSQVNTWRWRLRKSSAGAAVGFGVVNSVSTGLVTPMSAQTALTLTASTPTATIVRAVGIAYTDIGGIWRLRFNASWTVASASRALASVTFSGVTFKNVANFSQAFSASTSAGGIATVGYCTVNTGTINVEHATATTTAYYVSGDVELESKPTWA